jgi:hypothetical protein
MVLWFLYILEVDGTKHVPYQKRAYGVKKKHFF